MSRFKIFEGRWMWLISISFIAFGSADETEDSAEYLEFIRENWEDMNLTDCWNYGRNKSLVNAPVFRVNEENLSQKNCGKWVFSDPTDYKDPPWQVFLGEDFCEGVILSPKTIITALSDKCTNVVYDFIDQITIKIFGGECVDEKDKKNCFRRRGLLRKKLLDFKGVNIEIGRYFRSPTIVLWQVESLSLQPVCLWNLNNQNDAEEEFFYSQFYSIYGKVELLPEENCYEEIIPTRHCDLYGNSLCTASERFTGSFLLMRKGGRFFLRGILHMFPKDKLLWIDLLPHTRKFVFESFDLAVMPEISKLKDRIDFGPTQSFENCGRLPRQSRSKRENMENSDKAAKARIGFITEGVDVDRGQYPWHASLVLSLNPYASCGATLISRRNLVTAAHCLFYANSTRRSISNAFVILGMHDVDSQHEESRQVLKIFSMMEHPDYDPSKIDYRNDIALIILQNDVQFTEYVRPVCLWNSDYDLNRIANLTGTVVGWGHKSNHMNADVLQKANMRIVSYEECYNSKMLFFSVNLHPRENFCAGFPLNNTGACKGDSGGGLHLSYSGQFFLRGVVSMGRSKTVQINGKAIETCNPSFYSLFTDVTNYMQWIVNNTQDILTPENH